MRFLGLLLAMLVFMSLTNCRLSNPYQKQIKELDSLKIVVEEAIDYFNKIDSVECSHFLATQQSFKSFLLENLHDTLTKTEAENVQLMMNVGVPLKDYLTQKHVWISQAQLSLRQLHNLNQDLKNNALEPSEAVEYINQEKKIAEYNIQILKTNTELIRKNIEIYKSVVQHNESIIKKINAGNLPIIKSPSYN
jgi:hypothetical protein